MTENLPKSFEAILQAAFAAGIQFAYDTKCVAWEERPLEGDALEEFNAWRREWAGYRAAESLSDIVNSNWPGAT